MEKPKFEVKGGYVDLGPPAPSQLGLYKAEEQETCWHIFNLMHTLFDKLPDRGMRFCTVMADEGFCEVRHFFEIGRSQH